VVSGPSRIEAPDAGLVLGLALLASLAGTLLLGADALAVPASAGGPETTASPLARMLGRRALLLAAGLSLIGAGLVFRVSAGGDLIPLDACPGPRRTDGRGRAFSPARCRRCWRSGPAAMPSTKIRPGT
jgi:hypothetical protein